MIESDPYQTHFLSEKQELKEEKMKVEETKEFEPLKNGVHKGRIVDVEEVNRSEYDYVDISISVDDYVKDNGEHLVLRVGFPAKITENTGLGKFIKDMGIKLVVGKDIDLDELRGIGVEYMTKQVEVKQTDGSTKTYSNIVKDSIVKV